MALSVEKSGRERPAGGRSASLDPGQGLQPPACGPRPARGRGDWCRRAGLWVKRSFLGRDNFLPFFPTHPGSLVQAFPTAPPPATLSPPLLPEARASGRPRGEIAGHTWGLES